MRWVVSTLIVLMITIIAALLLLAPKPPLLQNISFSQAIYDQKQHLLRLTLSQDDKYRLYIPLDNISPLLIKATLLQEDQYFYRHPGINPWALLKATWRTYFKRDRRIGASTITMQVAHLRYNIQSKTFTGKLLQIWRALQLERYYSKKEILEAYLNLAPYGNNIEGVGAASLVYFGKSAKQISLPEALTLAVIPQYPAQRGPTLSRLQSLKETRDALFKRWLLTYPNDATQKALITLPLQLQSIQQLPFLAPHFVDDVLSRITTQPLKKPNKIAITTTLDLKLQKILEKIIYNYLQRREKLNVNNATALLVDTRTMEIKASVGSANFFNNSIDGQVDGTRAKRSPGSTLKPFIYALALDQGLIHPLTVLQDAPKSFGSFNPENFDHDFMGPIKAKDALILSRNIPPIDLAAQLKKPNLYQFLQQGHVANLKSEPSYGLSLVLGAGEVTMRELVALYAMLVNGGVWQPLRTYTGESLLPNIRLLSPEASFLVLNMLKDAPRPIPLNSSAINNTVPVAWKTGTSSGYRDAWSIASFGPYLLAVWVGNFDGSSNPAFFGKKIAGPLLFEIIDAIEAQTGPLPVVWPNPKTLNLIKIKVCEASGLLPTRFCPNTVETWFIPGKSPIKTDTIYREVLIDRKTGLRACRFDQDNKFEVYEFWPSNLLKIFSQAGIQRRIPPPYNQECALNPLSSHGISPQITSPEASLSYSIRVNQKQKVLIPFSAIADADVKTLYWFVNETFVGKSDRDKILFWAAKPGKFTVRVVDDQGRADSQYLRVQVVS